MKYINFFIALFFLGTSFAQNHSEKPIRFIIETENDIIGDMNVNSKRVKLFNQNNHLIYEADLFNGKELDETFFYYADDKKLEKERRIFHESHESGNLIFTYDRVGNLVEEVEIDEKGNPLAKLSMIYDKDDNIIGLKREVKHHEEDHLVVESDFKLGYDKKGRLISKTGFENGHMSENVVYYYYYEEGLNKIEKRSFELKLLERWEETVNKDGRRIEYKHFIVDEDVEKIKVDVKYTYDKYGNIVQEDIGDGETLKKVITFEYRYDDFGNWLERKEFKGLGASRKKVSQINRRIEYYNQADYEHPPMELDERFVIRKNKETGEDEQVSSETHVLINNESGEPEWEVRRNASTLYIVDEYMYGNNQLIKITHLNNFDKENAYTVFKYENKESKITEAVSYSFEHKVDEKVTYHYNEAGQLIREDEHFNEIEHGHMHVEISESFIYNAAGVLIQGTLLEYGSNYVITYSYDREGRLIKYFSDPNAADEENYTEKYFYKEGVLAYMELFEGEKMYEKVEYSYDENGELIKESILQDGHLHEVIIYQYFE